MAEVLYSAWDYAAFHVGGQCGAGLQAWPHLLEGKAGDEHHFVKKATNMALRAIGKRNRALNSAAVMVARRLVDSKDSTAQWVGRDALRELTGPAVTRRLTA
jgi:3-methyladenine DNA glycosylase AlkD